MTLEVESDLEIYKNFDPMDQPLKGLKLRN